MVVSAQPWLCCWVRHVPQAELGAEGQEGCTHGPDCSRILLWGQECGTLACQGTAAVQRLKRGSCGVLGAWVMVEIWGVETDQPCNVLLGSQGAGLTC